MSRRYSETSELVRRENASRKNCQMERIWRYFERRRTSRNTRHWRLTSPYQSVSGALTWLKDRDFIRPKTPPLHRKTTNGSWATVYAGDATKVWIGHDLQATSQSAGE
jgi:hypothetical protein